MELKNECQPGHVLCPFDPNSFFFFSLDIQFITVDKQKFSNTIYNASQRLVFGN